MKDLELVVPVKNEEKNVAELTQQIDDALKSNNISYTLIYIIDKSIDNTEAELKKLQRKYPIIIEHKKGTPGKAFSVLEGAQLAQAKVIGFIDGDIQYSPKYIPEMLKKFQDESVGVVVANRKTYQSSFVRKIGSRINVLIFGRLLLGLNTDIQSGLKLFRRDIVQHVDTRLVSAWTIDIPLLYTAKELGYKTAEVDIDYVNRRNGNSKVGFVKTAMAIARCALKTKFKEKQVYHLPHAENEHEVIVYRKKRYITHTNLPHHKSAIFTLVRKQKIAVALTLGILVYGLSANPLLTAQIFVAFLSCVYFFDVFFNTFLVLKSLHMPPELSISDEDVQALKDEDLPIYTIMCPLYKEWEVLPQFVENVSKLDWPKSKLEVLLLLEENDQKTIDTAKAMSLPDFIKIAVVPHSMPKTKPKACNYGLRMASGEYIVVYDAEDQPAYDQLKKAYIAFSRSKKDVFCIQAKLNYYNPHHNLLTKLFTAEYSLWFDVMLPGLQSIETTIPLGGTSNHFKTANLRALHGWDPFNVTEDCDLGCRMFIEGYRTEIIDSVTLEEANSDVKNWIRQRSRWIKGYMQTYFVHMRDPIKMVKRSGWHAWIFQLVIGLRIYFMLINPILWLATASYFLLYRYVGPTIESLYPSVIFYMAAISLVFGNFIYLYNYMIGCAKKEHWSIIKYVFLVPIYWMMMSAGAVMAFYQLIFKPHHWEKTNHGLHLKKAKIDILPELETVPALPISVEVPALAFAEHTKDSLTENKRKFVRLPYFVHKGITSAGILIAASVVGNFLNFLYNAYLSRKLEISDFGLISLIGSFSMLSTIPLGALYRTVAHKSAYYFGKYKSPINAFWKFTRRKVLIIGLITSGTWILLSPILKNFFNVDSLMPFIIFAPIWTISALAAVDSAYLNGNLKFKILSLMCVTEAVVKFSLTVLLVQMGLHNFVYVAIPFSIFSGLLLGYLYAKKLTSNPHAVEINELIEFPGKFFVSSSIISFSTIAFLSFDIILAKHFLSPRDAGIYALVSLIGKMIYLIGSLFGQFILPIISKIEGESKNSLATFYKIFALSTTASIVMYIIVGLFGHITAPILLGDKVIDGLKYLPLYGLSILAFTISSSLVSYNQVRKRNIFTIVSLGAGIAEVVGIMLFHRDIDQIVDVLVAVGLINLLITSVLHHFSGAANIITKNLNDIANTFQNLPKDFESDKNPGLNILILNWRDTKHVWAGGAEVYVHEIAKELIKAGNNVTILCGTDRKHKRFEIIQQVRIIRVGGFYTVYLIAPLYYLLKLKKWTNVVIDSENGIPFFTPLFANKPVIGLIHHVHQEIILTELKLPFWQLPMALVAKVLESKIMPYIYSNSKMITVSNSSKRDMKKIGFGTKSDIEIINPGIDPAEFRKSAKTDYPSILYLGRLKAYKRIDTLVMAMKDIVEKFPNAKLTIAGFGDNRPLLEKLAKAQGLESSIYFAGKVDDATRVKLMGQSWVFAYPSSMEGWGISIIEANACGTPVVASDVPGLRDSVNNYESGFLVELGNYHQFADKICALFSSENLRKSMGENAIKWAHKYTWKLSALKLQNCINELIVRNENYKMAKKNLLAEELNG